MLSCSRVGYNGREFVTPRLTVKCVECGKSVRLTERPRVYCSDLCRQILKLVHYGRRVYRDGRIEDPLVLDALQMRIAHILGGGYHDTARKLPPQTRDAVFTRDHGVCQLCDQPATDIDHIAGDSADLGNLRALCRACNMAEAERGFRPATPEMVRLYDELMKRMLSDPPVFERDDEHGWDVRYRQLAADQRVLIREDAAGIHSPTAARSKISSSIGVATAPLLSPPRLCDDSLGLVLEVKRVAIEHTDPRHKEFAFLETTAGDVYRLPAGLLVWAQENAASGQFPALVQFFVHNRRIYADLLL
jgi:5-methylcytosine-specific restriction endonuclease McrA